MISLYLGAGELRLKLEPRMSLRKHTTEVFYCPNSRRSTIYTSTEIGLTKATKALLADKPIQFCKPAPEFAPTPKQDNRRIVVKKKSSYGKRQIHSKLTQEALEDFRQNRLFQVIRNNEMLPPSA